MIKFKSLAVAFLLSTLCFVLIGCNTSEASDTNTNEQESSKQIVNLAFINLEYIDDPTNTSLVALEEHTVYEELTGDGKYLKVVNMLKQGSEIADNYMRVRFFIHPSEISLDDSAVSENSEEEVAGATPVVEEQTEDEDEGLEEAQDSNSEMMEIYSSYKDTFDVTSVEVDGNKATVNFDSKELSGNAIEETLLVSQIAQTLIRTFEEIEIVYFTIDSKQVNTLMGNVNVEQGISDSLLTTETDLEKRE